MILITGSKGFIGKNLIKKLGSDIIALDFHNHMEIFDSDFPWRNITKIYHLGALSSTTENNLERIHNLNVKYSVSLFEYAIEHKIPVTYASSASVYGNSLTYKINPLNYYALSKATVDYWVQDNMDRFSNVIGCRFFNVYGDGEEHKGSQASPIHQFTKQAKETGTIKIFEGSKDYFRDFVHIQDALDCMMTDKESGIYDVGTNNPVSFQHVASLVARKYNAFIEEIPFPEQLKNKYQWYTCSRKHHDHKFISVRDFLESS
jgi:ADP-L-glycero-D-manno-heptose 6-epimerase